MTQQLPAKLVAMIDQRVAFIKEQTKDVGFGLANTIVSALTEPDENASDLDYERWERTCDMCGTYVPPEASFYNGAVLRPLRMDVDLTLFYSVCPVCARDFEKED